jgi:serine protease Do
MGGCNGRPRRPILLVPLVMIGLVISAPTYQHLAFSSIGLANHQLDLISKAPAPADPVDPRSPQVAAGVVQIDTTLNYQNATGTGTGIVLSPDGEVLTNNHVVSGANRINATSVGTGKTYPVEVIGYDRQHDIALVQLTGASGLPTANIGDSSQVTVGEPVTAIGNTNGAGAPLTYESGRIMGFNQTVDASDDLTGSSETLTGLFGIAAGLRPGDSGGPLVNSAGQVVGLDTAAAINYRVGTPAGHGFAIPINDALAVAAQIRSRAPSGTVHIGDTPMLGVGVSTAGQSGSGAVVRDVMRGGPADKAGMVGGSVITAIDGTAIPSANTLTDLLDQHHPGDSVTVTWVDRGDTQHQAPIVLAVGPPG